MRPLRFVHAADLHLGTPFKGVDAVDERVRAALLAAPLAALDAVVDTCLREEADFLVIAGDVYDSAEYDVRGQLRFQRATSRLAEAGIRTFVVHGNHDPANGWSAELEHGPMVTFFSSAKVERATVERDGETLCAVYGTSYPRATVTDNLAAAFRREPGDPYAVAVLHANVGGRPGHEDYAPCSLEDLRAAGVDYWALGHIHQPAEVCASPLAMYAGCPQGLDPNESGTRGCWVVDAGPKGTSARFAETCALIWAAAEIDLSECVDLDGAMRLIDESCVRLRAETGDRPTIARLSLVGRTAVHEVLGRGRAAGLLEEVRARQMDLEPWVWVDRLDDRTRRPVDAASLAEREGLAGEVARLAAARAEPEEAAALLARTLEPVLQRLAVRLEPPTDAGGLVERARDLCLDGLLAEEEA